MNRLVRLCIKCHQTLVSCFTKECCGTSSVQVVWKLPFYVGGKLLPSLSTLDAKRWKAFWRAWHEDGLECQDQKFSTLQWDNQTLTYSWCRIKLQAWGRLSVDTGKQNQQGTNKKPKNRLTARICNTNIQIKWRAVRIQYTYNKGYQCQAWMCCQNEGECSSGQQIRTLHNLIQSCCKNLCMQ